MLDFIGVTEEIALLDVSGFDIEALDEAKDDWWDNPELLCKLLDGVADENDVEMIEGKSTSTDDANELELSAADRETPLVVR